jgi:small conductance mechanosensitive channel
MEALVAQLQTLALTEALPFFMKLGAALVLWFVGRTVINGFRRVLNLTLQRRKFDPTLIRYVESLFAGAFTILLLLGLLGLLGIETTSFAALLAAAGIAIGSAWSGLLSNFAAGVFLLVLRPFGVGDEISGGGVEGVVQEVGLFVTSLDTKAGLRIIVGNSQLLGGNIINFNHNPQRQTTVKVPLVHGSDLAAIKRALHTQVAELPDVLKTPGISIEVVEYTLSGPVLAVQVWSLNRDVDEVQNRLHQVIHESLAVAGYAVPTQTSWALSRAG